MACYFSSKYKLDVKRLMYRVSSEDPQVGQMSIVEGRSVPNERNAIIDLYIIRDTLAVIPAKAGIQQDKMPFV